MSAFGQPKKLSPQYLAYMASSDWQSVRAQVLHHHGRRCVGCMASKRLHMHHLFYPANIWKTAANHLLPVCERCHEMVHNQNHFHPTVFEESGCAPKRRETIVFLQQRSHCSAMTGKRATKWMKYADWKKHWADRNAVLRKTPTVINLSCRYGPRKTKTRRFLSTSEQAYKEKLFTG